MAFLYVCLVLSALMYGACAGNCKIQPPPESTSLVNHFPCLPFSKEFINSYGPDNLLVSDDELDVNLLLDCFSGCGFKSKLSYIHGFFSVSLQLPANAYTGGVLTSFYTSNAEVYPGKQDEVLFQFLGRATGEEYVLQTNVYVNGSTNTGREQRLRLWFDPSADYHNYSISWTSTNTIFYVDDIPIREFPNSSQLPGLYPNKPTYLYSTIADASEWATGGGRYKVNYSDAPYIAAYSNFILNGCAKQNPDSQSPPTCAREFSRFIPSKMTDKQRQSLQWVQHNFVTYDYCQDKKRYPNGLPECKSSTKSILHSNNKEEL